MMITDLKSPTLLRDLMCEKQYGCVEIAVHAGEHVPALSTNPQTL